MALAVEKYSCPVCGVALIQSDLDIAEGEYFCPYCSTEVRPSMPPKRHAAEPIRQSRSGGPDGGKAAARRPRTAIHSSPVRAMSL